MDTPEAITVLEQSHRILTQLLHAVQAARDSERDIAASKVQLEAARQETAKLASEMEARQRGLDAFMKHAGEARLKQAQLVERERSERLAIKEHEERKLDDVRMEIDRENRKLEQLRAERGTADRQLAAIRAQVDRSVEHRSALST